MHRHNLKREDFEKALSDVMRMRKYAFLYAPQTAATTIENITYVYVINKIETYASYTYPTVKIDATTNHDKDAVVALSEALSATSLNSTQLTSPYRTVSHYGFNCPLTYLPSISPYPSNLLNISDEFVADLHLQRNLVIEFLKSASFNLNNMKSSSKDAFVSIKEIHFTSPSSCNETETEEEPNYTTIKKLQLSKPNSRKRMWLRTTSTCSSTAQTATTSSVAYADEGDHHVEEGETSGLYSLSTHFDDADCSAGSCASLPCPPPPPPPLPNKNFLRSYILRKSPSRRQSGAGVAELQFMRRPKVTTPSAQNDVTNNKIRAINKERDNSTRRRTSSTNSTTTMTMQSQAEPTPQQTLDHHDPQQQQAEEEEEKEKIDSTEKTTTTSIKAEINATKQTLDITISVHVNQQNQWSADAFKNLSQIIEAEIQLLSQHLTQNELSPNPKSTAAATTTSSSSLTLSNTDNNHFSKNLLLLEKELEKLLNSILCVNNLTQNLRTAYNETE